MSPDALECSASLPVVAAKSTHEALIQALNAHGNIVFASDEEALDFIAALRGGRTLPPGAAQRWIETLARLRQLGRISVLAPPSDSALSSVRDLDELRRGWAGRIDVAVLPDEASKSVGVPPDEGLLEDLTNNLEVATLLAAAHSQTIGRLRDLAGAGHLTAGTAREEFWNRVLAPAAAKSRTVTVLDAYLFRTLWRKNEAGAQARRWDQEHVAWLLTHLDRVMPTGATVELISESDPHQTSMDAQTTADLLLNEWSPGMAGSLGRVQLSLVPRTPRFPHDRHVRFGCGVAVLINAGFDRLSRRSIWDDNGMGWQYRWTSDGVEELRRREQRARDVRASGVVTVLER